MINRSQRLGARDDHRGGAARGCSLPCLVLCIIYRWLAWVVHSRNSMCHHTCPICLERQSHVLFIASSACVQYQTLVRCSHTSHTHESDWQSFAPALDTLSAPDHISFPLQRQLLGWLVCSDAAYLRKAKRERQPHACTSVNSRFGSPEEPRGLCNLSPDPVLNHDIILS